MNKPLLAVILTLTAASANAGNWPWQESTVGGSQEYCKGFVVGGLASHQVSGMSRTDLWLAWNYVIRAGALGSAVATSELTEGLAKFQNVTDATTAEAILQEANGDCGLGRSGHEITGW